VTKAEAAEIAAMLSAAFPRPQMTEPTMKVYQAMLLDLDRDTVHKAACRLIATAKWLPTVSEIRSAAIEVKRGERRLAGEAWGDVNMAIRRFGRFQVPEFDDPVVADCVRQMGWLSLCDSTNDPADRARFIELYDGLAQRERRELVAGATYALPAAKGPQRGDLAALTGGVGFGGKVIEMKVGAK
jgi:hypothetical protein